MIYVSFESIHSILAPLLTAQVQLLVLLYFSIFCRHQLRAFPLQAVFLLSFSIYLVGQAAQHYTVMQTGIYILFTRTLLFLGIGVPSLVVALYYQCKKAPTRKLVALLYVSALCLVLLLITIQDIANYNYIFTESFEASLPFKVVNTMALVVLTVYCILILLIPCGLLAWREWRAARDPMNLAFLSGAILVALAQLASHHILNAYWIIYLGAIATTSCWLWAVYYDVKRSRGRAHAVKDELMWMLRSGHYQEGEEELNTLWRRLASISEGDVELYKLQVREVLIRLAERGVAAGASSETMLASARQGAEEVDKGVDADEVLSIATEKTRALGQLIAELPNHAVVKAKEFIDENYSQGIDIRAITRQSGSSQSYLMRNFKDECGVTINQYLTQVRIDAAKVLLREKSITGTAFEVGFNNSNYFSTVFKKVTGQTPGQYKDSLSS